MLIVDDFAPDALAVRDAVITGEFATETGPDGGVYTGISRYAVPQWYDLIARAVGKPIVPTLSCFRLNLAGELPHSWVHSDMICAANASVLYLNTPEQCVGGTAFWQHRTTGLWQMPEVSTPEFDTYISGEWKIADRWEQLAVVPMQFNRFVSYSTRIFHSRWPFEAFGIGPADGRLIWVCFYDVED